MEKRKLHALMLAGTGSDVGKSILATAICRILKQDGYAPAPFKAQNMALNSYATPEGFEIGRAQAVQAEAAGIPCHTDMNPLLLKPNSDHTSQVVLNGKPMGNRSAYDYFRKEGREELRQQVCEAYDRLAARYHPIVMEGAGSISELNLRETDLVNLPMARHADADVFLVGDIDRGGVFASLYGSVMLQSPEDRKRIKGIFINKFRGDLRLFESGVKMIEELCGIPVIGVIPYYKGISIEEEDSVELRNKSLQAQQGKVNVAVVMLRHISNFTDFNALERDERVHLYYTNNTDELSKADIIILPGTKSTLSDLYELRRNGVAQAILKAHREGTTVVGICGGYQMMGVEVCDPEGVEGEIPRLPGLGLLPMTTTMQGEKVTRQVDFLFRGAPEVCTGYEIHMGETRAVEESLQADMPAKQAHSQALKEAKAQASEEAKAQASEEAKAQASEEVQSSSWGHSEAVAKAQPLNVILQQEGDGRVTKLSDGCLVDDRCWGSYIHGILDNHTVIDALLAPYADKLQQQSFDYQAFKEEQYEKLADHVRSHMNMDLFYEILQRND